MQRKAMEQMANDLEKAAYYENKIQAAFDRFPSLQAELSAAGHQISSYGVCVHPDGTVSTYTCGDLKPEVRAKIEAKMKAEDEEKAKRKKQYQELSAEAAEQRRLLMEQYNQKQVMAEALQKQLSDTSNLYIVNQLQVVAPAVAAYENAMSTISSSMIQGI